MKRVVLLVSLAVLSGYASSALAIPQLINHQGFLTRPNGAPLDTVVAMTFALYPQASGGTALWTESYPGITVTNGLFHVVLGSVTPLPDAFSGDRWLGVTVGNNAQMTPRQQLASVSHAYRVGTVDGASGGTISGQINIGRGNSNPGSYANVLGDSCETRNSYDAVGGGQRNTARGGSSVVSGGSFNEASGNNAAIGGGRNNYATSSYAAVGGGFENGAYNQNAIVSGGSYNLALGVNTAVGGGNWNRARGNYSVVAGGGGSSVADSNAAGGSYSAIGGGRRNETGSDHTTISGGYNNTATAASATIGGGYQNKATVAGAVVSGGYYNDAAGTAAAIGGGYDNYAGGYTATASGGRYNFARGDYSVVAGGGGVVLSDSNSAMGEASAIGGGRRNIATSNFGAVGGGVGNAAGNNSAVVGGGYHNQASGPQATVGGGYINSATAVCATVGGGNSNIAGANSATVSGGEANYAAGMYSTIPGGKYNRVTGNYSFAAGFRAQTSGEGVFAWADATGDTFGIGLNNTFNARASNGFRFWTTSDITQNIGARLPGGSSTWTTLSDSTKKRNIRPVDTEQMLDRVQRLPIRQWSYITQDPSIEHIGPMAQDFWSLFHIGDDSLTISTIDPGGIALAAIQELAKRLYAVETENTALRARVQTLEAAQQRSGIVPVKR